MTTSVRRYLSTVAVLAVLGGILLLALPVSATTDGGKSVTCGTAFSPDSTPAERAHISGAFGGPFASNPFDGYAASCDDAISTRRWWGYSVGVAGLLLTIGIGMAPTRRPEDARVEGDHPVTPES